jgi:hypothetical protein
MQNLNMRGSSFELNPRAPGQWITDPKFEDSRLKNGGPTRQTGLMNSTEHTQN